MLFSLTGFETQTCTIICEPMQLYVCDVYLLNHAILVVMLIYRGLSGHSAGYRVYMSESMGVSMC